MRPGEAGAASSTVRRFGRRLGGGAVPVPAPDVVAPVSRARESLDRREPELSAGSVGGGGHGNPRGQERI